MTRILHFSDSHGFPPEKPEGEYDIVACTGDFLPDNWRALKEYQLGIRMQPISHQETQEYQREWVRSYATLIAQWVDGRPFVWCPGNHDRIDPCDSLAIAGVNVIDATFCTVTVEGISFYGFPCINWIDGTFMHERQLLELGQEVDKMIASWQGNPPDVLLAHAPMRGIFDADKNGNRYGLTSMVNRLSYIEKLPKLYLCGHVHKPDGPLDCMGMRVFNTATSARIIEL